MAFTGRSVRVIGPLLQFTLPHHPLSRLVGGIGRIRHPWVSQPLIRWFCRRYGVALGEAKGNRPSDYPSFNAFFTRELRPECRPVCPTDGSIACPADGTLSGFGSLEGPGLIPAKGQSLDAASLLGGSPDEAEPFQGGMFLTVYLAPPDYHRVHMPVNGTLEEMVHVPGRIFSVSPATTETIPRLFTRNERVVARFRTPSGPMALVLIGAMLVASIQTRWHGVVTPPSHRRVRRWTYPDPGSSAPFFRKGEEVARFNLGSTVITLFPEGAFRWDAELVEGQSVRMGQCLGAE